MMALFALEGMALNKVCIAFDKACKSLIDTLMRVRKTCKKI